MDFEKINTTPLSVVGIIVGTLIPLMLAVTIFLDGEWQFNVDTLSNLGISKNELAAFLFNTICMVGGVLSVVTGLGRIYVKGGEDVPSGVLLALAGIFLFLVGVFTKAPETRSIHIVVAGIFFALVWFAMLASMIADYHLKRRVSATITSIIFVVIVASMPGFTPGGVEVISFIGMYVWLIVQGLSLAFSKQ